MPHGFAGFVGSRGVPSMAVVFQRSALVTIGLQRVEI